MTAGIIAAIVVGVVAGVIVLLLSIPLDLSFYLGIGEKPTFRFGLRWFFGLVRKDFGGHKKQVEIRESRSWAWADLMPILGLLPDLWQLSRRTLRHIKIKDLRVDLLIGLGDPADTALFVGSLWAPCLLLHGFSSYAIKLRPSFDDGLVLQGYTCLVLRLRPIQIVPPVVRFGFSRSGIRLLGGLISRRWKRKR